MTKEMAIAVLKYNSKVIHQNINGETDPNEVEALDMAIKALEQQPSDDCVSRKAVIEIIKKSDACLYEKSDNDGLVEEIKTVTPTHGTCKDCKNGFQTSFCSSSVYGCEIHKGVYKYDFYCADFEKRGNKNDI